MEGVEAQGLLPQGDDPHDESDGVLEVEQENATNSKIFDMNTITIHLKQRVGGSYDGVSKPAKDWVWEHKRSMEVLTSDPNGVIERTMKRIWQAWHLMPHDRNLRTL